MRVLIRSALLVGLISIVPASFAQTGPVPPGVEILPAGIRHLAETPLVLTTKAAPTFCLEMSDKDEQARTVQAAACAARWNQKAWFEQIPSSSGVSQVRIRIGKLACLLPGAGAGARATMGICGDAPAVEPWVVRDGQLVGNTGLCLALPSAEEASPVTAETCNAASANQQWRLEAMRTALQRRQSSHADPSGFSEYFYAGYVADMVEEFRPRFSPRALTAAERAEIKSLTAPWRKQNPLASLIGKMGGPRQPAVLIPWATLRRLSELGESGDKEAMRAVMEAFALVRDTNWPDTFQGWDETAFPHANNSRLAHGVAFGLANLWGAHYWHRHGPDRVAAYAFTYCLSGLISNCLGYDMKIEYPKPTSSILEWMRKGDAKYAVNVRDITFKIADGTFEQREAKFASVLNGSAFTSVSDEQYFAQEKRAALAVFAERTGRLALWDNTMLNRSFDYPNFTSRQELYMRQTLAARADAAQWRAKFDAFMAKPAPEDYERRAIERDLVSRSDADLFTYVARHSPSNEDLEPRLCVAGREASQPCVAVRQAIKTRRDEYDRFIAEARAAAAVRQAEMDAQAAKNEAERRRLAAMYPPKEPDFWDQLAGLAEGFAVAAEAGNQQVTVRTYDSAGNFVGTETMSRSRAMGLGAQTSN